MARGETLNRLVDCHAHLDLLPDPGQAVIDSGAAGVGNIIAVGIDLDSSRRSIAFAASFPGVRAAIGIHPHGAAGCTPDNLESLAALAVEPGVVAIGETGLDFYRDRAPRAAQKELFLRHIDLAGSNGLPLIVHSRDAGEATLEILAREAAGLTVILHCFALVDDVEECAQRGYYMSIAGNVTYKNATSLQAAAARIPPDLLLTETDAPYLAPVPYRGKTNSPEYIVHIIGLLAELRSTTVEALAPVVLANFYRAFTI